MDTTPILVQAAARLIELVDEKHLFAYTAELAGQMVPDAFVSVVSFDLLTTTTAVQAVFGPQDRRLALEKILGRPFEGLVLPVLPASSSDLGSSKLVQVTPHRLAGDLPDLPEELARQVERVLDLGEAYAVGLVCQESVLGALLLLLPVGQALDCAEAVETLASLAAVALHRLRVEKSLRQSEEDYRKIFENAHDAILIIDPDGLQVLEVNPRACQIYGYERAEFTGLSFDQVGSEAAQVRQKVQAAFDSASRVDFETIHYRKDGAELFIQVSATPIDYQGRPAVLCINRDTTDRKLTEIRLDLNARRLAALSRMGQIVTSSLELEEVLYRVTNEAQRLLGVDTIAILLQENDRELKFVAVSEQSADKLLGVHVPAHQGAAGRVLQTGQPVILDLQDEQEKIYQALEVIQQFRPRSLLVVPLVLNYAVIGVVEAIFQEAGAFTQDDLHTLEGVANWAAIAIANARQYTTIQQRLQESETITEIGRSLLGTLDLDKVLQRIVNSAQRLIPNVDRAVIHLVDEQHQTLEMASATGFEKLEGPFFTIRPGEGVAGKVLAEGKTINVSDTQTDPTYLPLGAQSQSGSLLVAPIQSGASLLGTLSVRSSVVSAFSKDHERLLTILGVQAALAIHNARLFEAEQESRQLAEVLLQQEKATRAQLVQSEKLAALGRIVASVAHELNNPLQAIQNAIYLVQMEDSLGKQTQDDLKVALNEANRMAELIARLRETYRPAASEEFNIENLNVLVEDIQKLLSTHTRHRNITFLFEADPGLPPIPVIRDQIRQVILNISLNAIESMSAGGSLAIRSAYVSGRHEASLTFTDNGPGISPEVLPNIFDPFFTTKEGGTGLGLAITYDIVQRHKGRIEVESQLGKGTVFKVWLPVGQAGPKLPAAPQRG